MPRKILKGTVVSTKMEKTVVVSVEVPKMHPLYKKVIRNSRKFKARDDIGVNEGDMVEIEESKPFSKTVHWKVTEVLEEAIE